jgi:hypothetical protein
MACAGEVGVTNQLRAKPRWRRRPEPSFPWLAPFRTRLFWIPFGVAFVLVALRRFTLTKGGRAIGSFYLYELYATQVWFLFLVFHMGISAACAYLVTALGQALAWGLRRRRPSREAGTDVGSK